MEKNEKNTGILKKWVRQRMQIYELVKTLQTDDKLRHKWIKRRTRAILNKNPKLDEDKTLESVTEFFERIEILVKTTKTGKPTPHISPRKVGGLQYTEILGIKSSNLTGCITRLIDSAADDIIKGYRKGAILSDLFGNRFSSQFNNYVRNKIRQEASR